MPLSLPEPEPEPNWPIYNEIILPPPAIEIFATCGHDYQ